MPFVKRRPGKLRQHTISRLGAHNLSSNAELEICILIFLPFLSEIRDEQSAFLQNEIFRKCILGKNPR